MGAKILDAGPLCTVQDLGRRRGRRLGIAPGGAMDRRAFLWANHLLGNDPGDPGLEVTLGGLTLEFDKPTTLALTGADCHATVAGRPIENWCTTRLSEGERLRLGYPRAGLRAYIAFPGGLEAERFFGSASVVLREGLPGGLGSPMKPGDVLEWSGEGLPGRRVPPSFAALPGPHISLPILTGFEWDSFSEADRRSVWESEYSISPQSDRIATRLDGPPMNSGPTILDSTPLVDGTIQILPTGCPLVFMRDRPTMGGYPKIGSVVPEALDQLAQAAPGTRVRFTLGSAKEAREALRSLEGFFGLAAS
jgi:5-oxoprolinase (ATP-hydrolysing) subunit C